MIQRPLWWTIIDVPQVFYYMLRLNIKPSYLMYLLVLLLDPSIIIYSILQFGHTA